MAKMIVRWSAAAALILTVATIASCWSLRSSTDEAAGSAHADAGTAVDVAERRRVVNASLRALEDAERDTPRDRWDPAFVVAQVGADPGALTDWVREHTAWIPYRGVLRGARGVLLDRQGNALDRALLLATLLEVAGHEVRLAHVELPRERASALLADLATRESLAATPPAGDAPDTSDEVARTYGLDAVAIERTLEAQRHAVSSTVVELHRRVAAQVGRLLDAVPVPPSAADRTARYERALAALQDHWWVQRRDGDRWVDLDVLETGAVADAAASPEMMAPADVPTGLRHALAVRVIVERWAGGRLAESRALDHTVPPADHVGAPLVLQVWPGDIPHEVHSNPTSEFGLQGILRQQTRWTVSLTTGGTVLAQATISTAAPDRQTEGYGALGGSLFGPAPSVPSASSRGELTAAWIEYELRGPGEEARTFRRTIVDALGAARRAAGAPDAFALDDHQRLARNLGLMVKAEILPVTSRLAPEFVAHLSATSTLGNRKFLELIARRVDDGLALGEVAAVAAPTVSPLISLAYARLEWHPASHLVHVDRVGLLTRHTHLGLGGDGIVVRGATDVVAGDVGVTLMQPDAFPIRVLQGVVDSNAEALWWSGAAPMTAAEAWAASERWATLTPTDGATLATLELHEDARAGIAADLARGLVVVAPLAPVAIGGGHYDGWWRIDPVTGVTSGVAGSGRGNCAPEYSTLLGSVVSTAGQSFAYEMVLCHGIAQAYNQFRESVATLQRHGYIAWWMPQIVGGSGVVEVARDVAVTCLIGAIGAGMISTAALLPTVIRSAEAAEAAALLQQSRQAMASMEQAAQRSRTLRMPRPAAPAPRPPAPRPPAPTLVDEPLPLTQRAPRTGPATPQEIAHATQELQRAAQESRAAFDELMAYRNRYPSEGWNGWRYDHPNFSPELDEALANEMMQKHLLKERAMNHLQDLLGARRPQLGPNFYQIAAGHAELSHLLPVP